MQSPQKSVSNTLLKNHGTALQHASNALWVDQVVGGTINNASDIRLVKPGKVNYKILATHFSSDKQSVTVKPFMNGQVAAQDTLKGDGVTRELQFASEISASSWGTIRVAPPDYTNPFFVLVDGKPIRANKHSAAWCLAGVEQWWKSKAKTYHPHERKQAESDYDAPGSIVAR